MTTRNQAIETLTTTTLGEEIGLGGYTDSAAYKLANGDIDASTDGLSDEVRDAIRTVKATGGLEFAEIGR